MHLHHILGYTNEANLQSKRPEVRIGALGKPRLEYRATLTSFSNNLKKKSRQQHKYKATNNHANKTNKHTQQ